MTTLAARIIAWQRNHGRNDLPWQNTRDPYRIWLSEIMLQQTQVAAVIPYYERFLTKFPDIATLASADVGDVLRLWAGLGYYARARNLHRAAQQVVAAHGGVFPADVSAIHSLPGIGRSTAAAIAAFSAGARAAILDGNVKRVFSRHFAVRGDVRTKVVEDCLWRIAEEQLPLREIERYTQGLMDLGATVCTRTKPLCLGCPLEKTCLAKMQGLTDNLPEKQLRREKPHRQTRMMAILDRGRILLEKRPPTGIWGGLWSLPEAGIDDDPGVVLRRRYGFRPGTIEELAPVQHGFTHYSLSILPWRIAIADKANLLMEPGTIWMGLADAADAAIPAPVKRIICGLGAD